MAAPAPVMSPVWLKAPPPYPLPRTIHLAYQTSLNPCASRGWPGHRFQVAPTGSSNALSAVCPGSRSGRHRTGPGYQGNWRTNTWQVPLPSRLSKPATYVLRTRGHRTLSYELRPRARHKNLCACTFRCRRGSYKTKLFRFSGRVFVCAATKPTYVISRQKRHLTPEHMNIF